MCTHVYLKAFCSPTSLSFNLTAVLHWKAHLSPGEVTINDASGIEPILKHLDQVLQLFTKTSFTVTRVQGSDPESSAWKWRQSGHGWMGVVLHIYWLGNGEQLEAVVLLLGCRRGWGKRQKTTLDGQVVNTRKKETKIKIVKKYILHINKKLHSPVVLFDDGFSMSISFIM